VVVAVLAAELVAAPLDLDVLAELVHRVVAAVAAERYCATNPQRSPPLLAHRVRSLLLPAASTLLLFACATPPAEPSVSLDSSEIRSTAVQSSCWDECAAAGDTCTITCGATAEECAAATATCFDSCDRGVGPWLPC
jgi:hypothetical protein